MTAHLNSSFPPKRIIIRMPNWLGDFVMATPILKDVRHHWPEATLTVMCSKVLSTVIQEDPNVNHVLTFDKMSGCDRIGGGKVIEELKQGNYDIGILLTNSFSSALWFWRAGIPYRLGYADHWRSLLLSPAHPFPLERETQHLVITYKKLLEPLGISVSDTSPHLYLTEKETGEAIQNLAQLGVQASDLLIGINPGAAYGSAKCWLPERFTHLTQRLLEHTEAKLIFFGDRAGLPLVEGICEEFPKDRVINLAARTTLRELMAYIARCTLFLTNDSGPMHVASALGTPLIVLFGSTSDVATGPYHGGKVIHKRVPCSPCYRRECPIDFRCMKRIEVQEVYETIQESLKD